MILSVLPLASALIPVLSHMPYWLSLLTTRSNLYMYSMWKCKLLWEKLSEMVLLTRILTTEGWSHVICSYPEPLHLDILCSRLEEIFCTQLHLSTITHIFALVLGVCNKYFAWESSVVKRFFVRLIPPCHKYTDWSVFMPRMIMYFFFYFKLNTDDNYNESTQNSCAVWKCN